MSDEEDYVQADLRVAEFMRMPPESRQQALDRSSTQEGAPGWLDCAKGEDFRSQGDLPLAVEAFARAVQQDPDSPLARAPLLFFLTKGERRLCGLRALAERWPGIGRVRLYLGGALVACDRAQEAVEEYSEATTRGRKYPSETSPRPPMRRNGCWSLLRSPRASILPPPGSCTAAVVTSAHSPSPRSPAEGFMGSGNGCYGGRCRCLPLNFGLAFPSSSSRGYSSQRRYTRSRPVKTSTSPWPPYVSPW